MQIIVKNNHQHLTQTEKKHICKLFELNLTEGKVNRKEYYITEKTNVKNCYSVKIIEVDNSIAIGKKLRQNTVEFNVKN